MLITMFNIIAGKERRGSKRGQAGIWPQALPWHIPGSTKMYSCHFMFNLHGFFYHNHNYKSNILEKRNEV